MGTTARTLCLVAALSGCSSARLQAVELESRTLSRELLAHWSFDDGSGTTAHDDSGNARDGQLTGGTWLQDGQFGGALHLGDGEYVSVERFPDATSSFTVSAWVRLSSYVPTGSSDNQWTSVISTEQMGGWEVNVDHLESDPALHFGYWKGPAQGDYVGHSCLGVTTGAWNQIVGMVDPSTTNVTFTIYLNGQLCFQTSTPDHILPGSGTLDIGQSPWGARFLVADVDDISIWSRALVPAEVELLNRTPPPPGTASTP
jgi:hypothetical protein